MLKSLLGQNNIRRIAKCGQGVLKRFGDFEYGGFYSKVNTEILRTPPQTDATLQMAVTTLYLARILLTVVSNHLN